MIIFLNGASSTGKTALARSLQAAWRKPLLYWSLDAVISQMPFKYTGHGSKAEEGFPLVVSDVPDGQEAGIFAGVHGEELNDLSSKYVKVLSDAGYDVVVDYVLLDEAILRPFECSLFNTEVLFVGLTCDPDILLQRNQSREDRALGLSVNQQGKIHFCRSQYDLELDSTRLKPDALAQEILAHLKETPATKGFG